MKRRNFKVLLASILCLVILFTSISGVFAKSTTETYTVDGVTYAVNVTDAKGIQTIKVSSNGETSIVTVNKKTGEIQLKDADNNVNLDISKISSSSTEVNLQKPSTTTTTNFVSASTASSYTIIDSGHNINADYYYSVYDNGGSNYTWHLTIPSSEKTVYENTTNATNLNYFRDKVNALALKEYEIAASFGTGVCSIIVACLAAAPETLGVTAVIALLVAAGAGITAAVLGMQAYFIAKDCRYYYNRV